MQIKPLRFVGLIVWAAVGLFAQPPTNGPVYWSSTVPYCYDLGGESAIAVYNTAGTRVGYSCYVNGTFAWLAAGGGWGSAIRTAAPSSAPLGVDITFYDSNGNDLSLDTSAGGVSSSGNEVGFALAANQPVEVDLLGATSSAPSYSATTSGSAYVMYLCPDENTCAAALGQLVYSNLPSNPWSLTVPLAPDASVWTQWSAEGIDDGNTHLISLVIYNQGYAATSFNVYVYNSAGHLVGKGTTPSIPGFQPLPGGYYGQGGTYGALLKDVITTPLPSGIFKILVDGGAEDSTVQMFQFTGPSATGLQVGYDSAPTSTAVVAAAARRTHVPTVRPMPTQHRVLPPLTQ